MKVINAGSPKHETQIREFGEFIGADSIEYVNSGNGEDYIVDRGGVKWRICVRGNRVDGGFAAFRLYEVGL